jgi:hypothetical protein
MEYPRNFTSIQGREVISLSQCYEYGSSFIEVTSKDDMDDEHTYVDEVHYDYVDVNVMVNYPSKLQMIKKDKTLL